jgi:hypothetical protein
MSVIYFTYIHQSMYVWLEELLSTICTVHLTLKQFQEDIVIVIVAPTVHFILSYTFRVLLNVTLLNFVNKLMFTDVLKCIFKNKIQKLLNLEL